MLAIFLPPVAIYKKEKGCTLCQEASMPPSSYHLEVKDIVKVCWLDIGIVGANCFLEKKWLVNKIYVMFGRMNPSTLSNTNKDRLDKYKYS
ncbi:hypothetical protein Godav_011778 [Gossypium davidsonii]|uniref:Uncharacterized protein n=2 Tax=Gossypium TaxID=3633 RepID=A0A7J8RBG5_GOSDV|nr:hypothetical protein [Gossypium davidsonii]MBA0646160.1 hypothetical protein [Gossypium klotzschianum]